MFAIPDILDFWNVELVVSMKGIFCLWIHQILLYSEMKYLYR